MQGRNNREARQEDKSRRENGQEEGSVDGMKRRKLKKAQEIKEKKKWKMQMRRGRNKRKYRKKTKYKKKNNLG